MRIILFVLFLMNLSTVTAQTDNKRPSWSSDLPEREKSLNIGIDNDIDTTLDIDIFGRHRDSTVEEKIEAEERVEQKQLELEQQEQQKAEKLAKEKERSRIIEEEKNQIENDKLAEQERITSEKKLEVQPKEVVIVKQVDSPVEAPEVIAKEPETTKKYTWKKIKNSAPIYPERAARNNREGWVEVEVIIDIEGNVVTAVPISSYKNKKTFNKAAVKAIKKWKFEPPANFGITTNQTKSVKIAFKL